MKFSEGVRLSQVSSNGCVVIRGHVRHICLPPRYLNGEIKTGIREDLNYQLGRYSDELDGIVLCHSNIKIMQKNPILLYDNVDMHFDVQYDVVIFRAVPGSLLKCKINEVATNHLSCLIHQTVNIAVALPEVNFDLLDPKGLDVVCRVQRVEYKKGILGLSAELTDESLKTLQEFYTESKDGYPKRNSYLGEPGLSQSSASLSNDIRGGNGILEGSPVDTEGGEETSMATRSQTSTSEDPAVAMEDDRPKVKRKKDKKRRNSSRESSLLAGLQSPSSIPVGGLIKTGEKRKHPSKVEEDNRAETNFPEAVEDLPSPFELEKILKKNKKKKKKSLPTAAENPPSPDQLVNGAEQSKDGLPEMEEYLPSPGELKDIVGKIKRKKKKSKGAAEVGEKSQIDEPKHVSEKKKSKELPVFGEYLPSPEELKGILEKKKKKKKKAKPKHEHSSGVEEPNSGRDAESVGMTPKKKKKRKKKHSTAE